MKILMTTDSVGGVFVYSVELVRELTTRGHKVILAVLGRPLSSAQSLAVQGIHGLHVEELPGALEWMDAPWQDVAATGGALLRLAQRVQPDCVHLNEFAHGAQPWPAPAVVVGHSCVESWWHAVHGERAPAQYERYREVVRAGLAAASCVIAPSRAQLHELARHYGPLPRARTIVNGIDASSWKPQPKQPVILSAGRLWDAAKNAALLARVAPALDWPVLLAGDTQAPGGGASELAADNCRTLGPLTRAELADVMARAAIYALPARYEPFGLSILEAAASGCALVLGRVPSLVEHWTDAACFVDPNDAAELQHTLQTLIADPERCAQLAGQALERARAFSAERMGTAYEQLYSELARTHFHVDRGGVPCAS